MSIEESVKIVDKASGLRQQQAMRRLQRREAELSSVSIATSAALASRKARLKELELASRRIEADLISSNLSRSQTPSITARGRGDLITTQEPLSHAGIQRPPSSLQEAAAAHTTPGEEAALPLEKLDQKPWLVPKIDPEAMRDPYLRRYGLHRNDTHLMSHVVRSQLSRTNFAQRDDVNFDFQGYLKYSS